MARSGRCARAQGRKVQNNRRPRRRRRRRHRYYYQGGAPAGLRVKSLFSKSSAEAQAKAREEAIGAGRINRLLMQLIYQSDVK